MAGPRRGVGDRKGYAGREAPGASAAGAVARSGSVSSRSPLVDLRLPMSAVGAHAPSRTWKGPLAAAEEAFHHLPWPKRLRPAKSPVVLRSVRYPCFGQKPQRFPLCVIRRRVRNRACGLSGSPRQETAAVGRTAPDERGRNPAGRRVSAVRQGVARGTRAAAAGTRAGPAGEPVHAAAERPGAAVRLHRPGGRVRPGTRCARHEEGGARRAGRAVAHPRDPCPRTRPASGPGTTGRPAAPPGPARRGAALAPARTLPGAGLRRPPAGGAGRAVKPGGGRGAAEARTYND